MQSVVAISISPCHLSAVSAARTQDHNSSDRAGNNDMIYGILAGIVVVAMDRYWSL